MRLKKKKHISTFTNSNGSSPPWVRAGRIYSDFTFHVGNLRVRLGEWFRRYDWEEVWRLQVPVPLEMVGCPLPVGGGWHSHTSCQPALQFMFQVLFPRLIGFLFLALIACLPLISLTNKMFSIQGQNSHLTLFLLFKSNDGLFKSPWSYLPTYKQWTTE